MYTNSYVQSNHAYFTTITRSLNGASGSLFDSYRIDRPSILAFKLQQLFWGHSFWHNGGFAVDRRHVLQADE